MWSEQFCQLLPELFDRDLLVVVIDADLVVRLVRLGAGHLFDLQIEFSNEILLDLRLYRKINQKHSIIAEMEVYLQKSSEQTGLAASPQRFYSVARHPPVT